MKKISAVAVAVFAALMFGATPAEADPLPSRCERVPILGLNPQIRTICDRPIRADGSWERFRQFSHPQYTHSTCFGQLYQGGCPNWAKDARDINPAYEGPLEQYVVTPDTIPDGEPGHLE